jgi:hypothetical protein
VAVVPLSLLDEKGNAKALRGWSGDDRDALSVFAVFETSSQGPTDRLRLGQIFSTGLAAQELTQGYECHMKGDTACASPAPVPAPAPAPVAGAVATPPATSDRPYQLPLVYARTDIVGIDIGGSAAEQGAVFTLGYSGRNLAVVPTYAPESGQRAAGLLGNVGDATTSRDASSVLGQFKSSTETSGLGFGIERYFATGIAAQNLSRGLRAAIAATPPPAAANH